MISTIFFISLFRYSSPKSIATTFCLSPIRSERLQSNDINFEIRSSAWNGYVHKQELIVFFTLPKQFY